MPLPKNFPDSPYQVAEPRARWSPDPVDPKQKKLPPLVRRLRTEVDDFRASGYEGATDTSRSLLRWWFHERHEKEQADGVTVEFQYYFAQREAMETLVYLYDVKRVRHPYQLMHYDETGGVATGMFSEVWPRFVIKMATGSGKTKVLALVLAWSYFHRLYEEGSDLARNFLVIAPNIIVLDRLRLDFDDFKIFRDDPVLPLNGHDGRDWRNDFQMTLHVQDEVRGRPKYGNVFLTNIHRVYAHDPTTPSAQDDDTTDYYLGERPRGDALGKVDLGAIVRELDELAVFNDEAHHIHDERLAWFRAIQDIHHRMVQKGSGLALQLDTTATPRHPDGAVFVQTVTDYPLVEAISQNVVKHPVLPDAASRGRLCVQDCIPYVEKYTDYLHLGVVEWRKAYEQHKRHGKKAVLFVMTDNTRNCDEVAEYLQRHYADLKGAVLVIHTKNNGEISESATGKAKEELDELRKQARNIDSKDSPYKAIVSVLVLKEGWDVRNVTTIVGLRAFTVPGNILPEQTLGRGLRRMYPDRVEESVSVIGTEPFMEFVESINRDGVVLEHAPMGDDVATEGGLLIEIDRDKDERQLAALDIEVPRLTDRMYRHYEGLAAMDAAKISFTPVEYRDYGKSPPREIVFTHLVSGEESHRVQLDGNSADYRAVLQFWASNLIKELRLVSGYAPLYDALKIFVRDHLFGKPVELESPQTLRNLATPAAHRTVREAFIASINHLTITERGTAEVDEIIKVRRTRPFRANAQENFVPVKSVFNRIIGDSHLELRFARFLEECEDVIAYAKNYRAVQFHLDYINADGAIAHYYPDFLVKTADDLVIIETKGVEYVEDEAKIKRLRQWCEDVNAGNWGAHCAFVYVEEDEYNRYYSSPHGHTFAELREAFTRYQEGN